MFDLTRHYEARCGWAAVAVGSQLGYPATPLECIGPAAEALGGRKGCRRPSRDRASGTARRNQQRRADVLIPQPPAAGIGVSVACRGCQVGVWPEKIERGYQYLAVP